MSLEKIIYEKSDLTKAVDKQKVPEHVAIIMDGNGRWATKKGFYRFILKSIDRIIDSSATHILVDGKSQLKFLFENFRFFSF